MTNDKDKVVLRVSVTQKLHKNIEELRKRNGMVQYRMLGIAIEEYIARENAKLNGEESSATEPMHPVHPREDGTDIQ